MWTQQLHRTLQADKARRAHMKAYLELIVHPCAPPEHCPKVNGQPPEDTRSAAQATLYRIMNTAEVMAPSYPSLTKDMHGIVAEPQHWKDPDEGTPLHAANRCLIASIDQRELLIEREPHVDLHLLRDDWAVRLSSCSVDATAGGTLILYCVTVLRPNARVVTTFSLVIYQDGWARVHVFLLCVI
jgi:hypothetical protein